MPLALTSWMLVVRGTVWFVGFRLKSVRNVLGMLCMDELLDVEMAQDEDVVVDRQDVVEDLLKAVVDMDVVLLVKVI